MAEESVPQWKRELIERRRAVSRATSSGVDSALRLSCPGVVTAVQFPHPCQGMRLPSAVPDIQQIISEIQGDRKFKMGEEKTKKLSPEAPSDGGTGGDEDDMSDSSEEFKYGPGIVSKLKSKYLSLTLRETHKTRPSLSNLRRATSLENILDETEKPEETKPKFLKNTTAVNGNATQTRRALSRNKENMKRARSVEALMRYNRGLDNQKTSEIPEPPIASTRNRISFEEKELPPPDLVKQALKIFEQAKSPSVVKTSPTSKTSPINKPAISPKPSIEKNGRESTKFSRESLESSELDTKQSHTVVNGYVGSLDAKTRLRKVDLSPPSEPPPPRPIREIIRMPADVKIIEDVKSEEKRTVSVIQANADEGDFPKLKASATNDRSPSKEKSLIFKDRPSLLQRSSPVKDRPLRSPDSPKIIGKEEIIQQSQPSPKPRVLNKSADRRQVDAPLMTPEPPLSASPGESRPFFDGLTSPVSQMKQVGVIRPIVTHKQPQTHTPPQHKFLQKSHCDRELENNLLNHVKSVEQPVTKVIVSLKKSPEECTVASPKPQELKKISPTPLTWSSKPNTIVFNFSDRKNVPDYIENDGLILTSKKDRPKVGDGGVIRLHGSTDDSTNDFESDDSVLDPPSPCHIHFIGANVLINGKSSLQKAPKRTKMRIKFNEEAPTLYEYPSEASLLEEMTSELPQASASSPGLNTPLKSTNFSSYTPSKVTLSSEFELGVTRSQVPYTPTYPRPVDHDTSEEEDYLRPADDANTVAWSAETNSDLLF